MIISNDTLHLRLCVAVAAFAALSATGCKVRPSANKIHNITLKLTGDERSQRRFRGFLQLELEDVGITLNPGAPSDATVAADFKSESQSEDYRIEVISQELRWGVQTKTVVVCPSISTGGDEVPANQDAFLQGATGAAREVRLAFPDAKSLRLDLGSSYVLAPKFPKAFEEALPAQQLALSSDPQTMLVDKITLSRVAAPTYGKMIKYEVNVLNTELSQFTRSGNSGLQNETPPVFPPACAKDWLNHDWSETSDPLLSIAHRVAQDLAAANAAKK